ncbi:SCP2 domain-containing protein [Celerinatantimonas sp. YJH-8]|uniref:ubiquinone biosynthesis accessory factor UbiJ n=1 Tax=Celerinatantimonas sp. YJH-8 TaxID=3228714 RepID=UPI0038CBF164
MPFSSLISAGIELVSNHYLQLDKASVKRQQPLVGKVIAVEIKPLPTVYFSVADAQLDVLTQYEGHVDSQLSLGIASLFKLQDPNRFPELIKSQEMELTGDIRLIQQFAELFQSVRPEPEEKLAQVIGDAPANLLFRTIHAMTSSISKHLQSFSQRAGEVMVEEWRMNVGTSEFRVWSDHVNQLEQSLSDLELRINRLLNPWD